MTHFEKPLEQLTASDLMPSKLITVPENMALATAARLLADADVRGAPVVDAEGRCVGVVSTTDFMRVAMAVDSSPMKSPCASDYYSPWQLINANLLPAERICHIMSKDPCSVSPDTPIGTLARMMVHSHIHRLIVVEDAGRLLGIVSATDLLDALAATPAGAAMASASR